MLPAIAGPVRACSTQRPLASGTEASQGSLSRWLHRRLSSGRSTGRQRDGTVYPGYLGTLGTMGGVVRYPYHPGYYTGRGRYPPPAPPPQSFRRLKPPSLQEDGPC